MKIKYLVFTVCVLLSHNIFSQHVSKLSQTPPMGWNSWNYFGKKNINEKIVKECIDAIAENGLKEAGYNYVIVDGGWRDVKLNEKGELLPHPVKFPNGMKPLADYAHSKGLKFGLHTVPGTHDCGGDKVGAHGIEEIHIQQFIDWGVDFLKVDKCQLRLDCEKSCWEEDVVEMDYRKWRTILDQKNSNIVISISAYKFREWNPEIGNLSRTTRDISCKINGGAYFNEEDKEDQNFLGVLEIADTNNKYAGYAQPGYWNDPDMLVTGDNGLSFEEQRTHFALWCLMSSPLFLGNDPRNISDEEKNIIFNKHAIKVNQDPTEQGIKIVEKDNFDVWKKNLSDGSVAVLIINKKLSDTITAKLSLSEIGVKSASKVYDIYDDKKLNPVDNVEFQLTPHACKFLIFKTNNK